MVKLKNIPGLSALYNKKADSAPVHSNSSGEVVISDLGLVDKINLRTDASNKKSEMFLETQRWHGPSHSV